MPIEQERVHNNQETPKPQGKRVAESEVTLAHLMQPEHANHLGNVHGGALTKTIDEAGALCATRHARQPGIKVAAVTVALDSMTFEKPVHIGDYVMFNSRLTYAGRKSMEVEVNVEAEDPSTGELTHTNNAFLVYVALDANKSLVEVPELILESDEERKRYEEGKKRQQDRLARRKKSEN
jgi:acyl-CoA hydrolase